jgi:glycosyltransferase involved in cell wall biosynthesis
MSASDSCRLRGAISLLVPAYNSSADLPGLLSDAFSQTVPFDEIIVYDDGSGDGTADVAEAQGATVIRGEINRGAGFARNRLIAASSGEWLHFHDADDRLAPDFNERMTRERAEPRVCIVCGAREINAITGVEISRLDWTAVNEDADQVRFFLKVQCAMVVGLYRRDDVNRIGGFREDLRGAEDYDFHVRLSQSGVRFRAIPDVLATIRRQTGRSFTERARKRYLLDYLTVLKEYVAQLPPDYSQDLGFVLADLAWRLFACGDRDSARVAIGLSRQIGYRGISSNSAFLRAFGRWVGAEPAFHIRLLKERLLRNQTSAIGVDSV